LIEGKIGSSDGEKYTINWAEGQPAINASGPEGMAVGTSCHFAIRPEKVAISNDKPSDKPNALQGRILDIGYLGNVSTYHVKLNNGVIMKAQMANNRRISRRDLTWDDEVWLSFTDTAGLVLLK
jgi:putrescine transport system ATP-binding protein